MLSGDIKGDDKSLKLNFRLLPLAAVAALAHCSLGEVEYVGPPSVAVPGGHQWSVCWTRAAAAQPLTFLRALAAAMDLLDPRERERWRLLEHMDSRRHKPRTRAYAFGQWEQGRR